MSNSQTLCRWFLLTSTLLLGWSCGGGGGGGKKNTGVPGANLTATVGGAQVENGQALANLSNGDSLQFSITNDGTSSFSLGPVLQNATDDEDVRDFYLTFESDYSPPNNPQSEDLALSIPLDLVDEDPLYGLLLEPDWAALKIWAQKGAGGSTGPGSATQPEDLVVARGVPLPGAPSVDLVLRRVAAPVTADAELWVDGAPKAGGFDDALVDSSMWVGRIAGVADSRVFLAFSPFGCRGWIQNSEALYHLIAEADPTVGWARPRTRLASQAQLQRAGLLPKRDPQCTNLPIPEGSRTQRGQTQQGNTEGPSSSGNTHTSRARIAFETDTAYSALFGDVNAATLYATQMLAAVGHSYQSQVQCKMDLVYLALYDTIDDPWQSIENQGDAFDLLQEFRDNWKGNWPVNADLGHLLSTGMVAGGVGYFDALCDDNWSFSVSTGIAGNINWSNFQFTTSILMWDFVVVAHEIAHNFEAQHTHEYCPPFDECAAPAAWGPCQTQRNCQLKGTLLSYCHTCPGGISKIKPEFQAYIANEMRHAMSVSCLPDLVLAPGETLSFQVTYKPKRTGTSLANLEWTHQASNVPSPFSLQLSGSN
jgi:metallopeptidase family M12-like protein